MPLEYALKTLNTQSLWLANPTIWKDPFEKRFLEASYKQEGKSLEFPFKDRVFCICMTQTSTSEAYWNTYSKDQIGISFKINKEALVKQLEQLDDLEVYIGRVEYMKTSDIKKHLWNIPFSSPMPKYGGREFYIRLLFLKRIAFEYENEVRIIVIKKYKTQEEGISLHYDIDNTNLFNSIILDPRLENETTLMLKELFANKYKFHSYMSGKTKVHRVLKSQLYSDIKPQKLEL